jgi:hypothetical protein
MKGEFIILDDGVLTTYHDVDDIPDSFDNLIKFLPEYPEPPHTEEQHLLIETFSTKMKEIMKREKK